MAHPPLSRRTTRRNRNQIRVSDEVPINEEIRLMAENLQNDHFNANHLVMLRSLPQGTIMMGIADAEIRAGEYVTFDPDENGCPRVRPLTFEQVQLLQSGETTSNHTLVVDRVARAVRHANIEEAIEFVISEHCEYVSAFNPAEFPGLPSINSKGREQDEKYPHICYKCKKKLKYSEAWTEIKKTGMTEEKFDHLWELEEIEFYCCFCYDKETRGSSTRESIYTRFRGAGRTNTNLFMLLEQYMNSPTIEGAPITHELNPTILFPDALHTLQSVATHRFGPQPHFTLGFDQEVPHRTIRQFRLDIRIMGDLNRHIQYRHNIVITTENHGRLRDIPDPIVFTVSSLNIVSMEIARLVAELVFHWISAKILFHGENTPWIPLNDRAEILPSINFFIERMTAVPRLAGVEAYERFQQAFQNFPHMWNHNNDSCDFCGLSPNEVYEWSPRRMAGLVSDYRERVLWRGAEIQQQPPDVSHMGFHWDYEMSPMDINRVNVFGGIVDGERLEVSVENPDAQQNGVNVFIDHFPEITSRAELEVIANSRLNRNTPENESISRMSLNLLREQVENEISVGTGIPREDLFGPHEHVWNGNLHCQVCGRAMVDIDAERNNRFSRLSRRFRRP